MNKLLCSLYILLFIVNALVVDAYQDFYWRDYFPGLVPSDALLAAPGKYIGQVQYGGNIPATIFQNKDEVYGTYDKEFNISSPTNKVFCTKYPERFYWEHVDFTQEPGNQMDKAVIGGYQFNVKEYLYIGKAIHENEWKIARAVSIHYSYPPHRGLWVWDAAGEQFGLKQFYLLKYNDTTTTSSCK